MTNAPTPQVTQRHGAAQAPHEVGSDTVDCGRLVGVTVAAVAIAVVLGCLIGYGVGVLTLVSLGDGEPSGWDLLGDALIAIAFAVVAAAATYIAVAIAVIVRWVPAGSRMWPILGSLVGVPLLLLAVRVLGAGLL